MPGPRDISTASPERRSRFLLVVDSDANSLFYISMLLQRFEYKISTATTAAEAMKTIGVAVPSMIIAAQTLSDMRGLEFFTRLRQAPRTAAVPFLIVLADRSPETERQCRQAGASSINGPIQAEELYRTVQAAIEQTPRKNIRISGIIPVTVNGKPLDCAEGECASVISEHGMYVRTLKPYPVGSRLSVQIVLKGRSVTVQADVLYSHRFGEGPFKEPGMGLKFVQIARQDQDFIRQLIREEIMKGIPG